MTRKGKIARLPQAIREQINRRLQNGEEGKQIAEWLNTLPEVIAVLSAEFDGQPNSHCRQLQINCWGSFPVGAGLNKSFQSENHSSAVAREMAARDW